MYKKRDVQVTVKALGPLVVSTCTFSVYVQTDLILNTKSFSAEFLWLPVICSYCFCLALKPKFAESDEILALSEHFVMVNTEVTQIM